MESLGEIAYNAWLKVALEHGFSGSTRKYIDCPWEYKMAWEAAAEAVSDKICKRERKK